MIDPTDEMLLLAKAEARVAPAINELYDRILALETQLAALRGTLNRPAEPDGPTVFVRARPNAPPNGDQP